MQFKAVPTARFLCLTNSTSFVFFERTGFDQISMQKAIVDGEAEAATAQESVLGRFLGLSVLPIECFATDWVKNGDGHDRRRTTKRDRDGDGGGDRDSSRSRGTNRRSSRNDPRADRVQTRSTSQGNPANHTQGQGHHNAIAHGVEPSSVDAQHRETVAYPHSHSAMGDQRMHDTVPPKDDSTILEHHRTDPPEFTISSTASAPSMAGLVNRKHPRMPDNEQDSGLEPEGEGGTAAGTGSINIASTLGPVEVEGAERREQEGPFKVGLRSRHLLPPCSGLLHVRLV
jgi:hypothetical protein